MCAPISYHVSSPPIKVIPRQAHLLPPLRPRETPIPMLHQDFDVVASPCCRANSTSKPPNLSPTSTVPAEKSKGISAVNRGSNAKQGSKTKSMQRHKGKEESLSDFLPKSYSAFLEGSLLTNGDLKARSAVQPPRIHARLYFIGL